MTIMFSVRIGRANVIEQIILAAGQLADFCPYSPATMSGTADVYSLLAGLAVLEVDVRVLGGAGKMRMLRIERARTEGGLLHP